MRVRFKAYPSTSVIPSHFQAFQHAPKLRINHPTRSNVQTKPLEPSARSIPEHPTIRSRSIFLHRSDNINLASPKIWWFPSHALHTLFHTFLLSFLVIPFPGIKDLPGSKKDLLVNLIQVTSASLNNELIPLPPQSPGRHHKVKKLTPTTRFHQRQPEAPDFLTVTDGIHRGLRRHIAHRAKKISRNSSPKPTQVHKPPSTPPGGVFSHDL
ncbi:putative ribonuclease H protein [Senna tora]|uniref:Putative ribonuclease H protein n=1 Tax=Senna tora TaxID=362788 RepID=A0A834TPN4_9FABA|nr:putative ribonuclease H protein [Senna tora]